MQDESKHLDILHCQPRLGLERGVALERLSRYSLFVDRMILLFFALFIIASSILLNMDAREDDHIVSAPLFMIGVLIRFALFMATLFMVQVGLTVVNQWC